MSTEGGIESAAVVNGHLEVLRGREDFLADRIRINDGPSRDYDRRELSAVRWAIPVLEAERDHLIRLRKSIEGAGGESAPEMKTPTCPGCGAEMVQGDDDWYCPVMEAEMDQVMEDHFARVAARKAATPEGWLGTQ